MRRRRAVAVAAVALAGCAGVEGAVFPTGTKFANLYFGGAQESTVDGVDAVLVDLHFASDEEIAAHKAASREVVCCVSLGTFEPWRPDVKDKEQEWNAVSKGSGPTPWLDITDSRVRGLLAPRFALAAQRGCDAFLGANTECFTHTDCVDLVFNGDEDAARAAQIGFNQFYALAARSYGLSSALMNTYSLMETLEPEFDFAIVERCREFGTCGMAAPFVQAGKAVLSISYEVSDDVCDDVLLPGMSIKYCDGASGAIVCPPNADWINCPIKVPPPSPGPTPVPGPPTLPPPRPAFPSGATFRNASSPYFDAVESDVAFVILQDLEDGKVFSSNLRQQGNRVACSFSAGHYDAMAAAETDAALQALWAAVALGSPVDGARLDITKREELEQVMEARIVRAKFMGCDAVVPMDMTCWDDEVCRVAVGGGGLPESDVWQAQAAYIAWFAETARRHALAVGLFNSGSHVLHLHEMADFWYIDQPCATCASGMQRFKEEGKAIFVIEFEGAGLETSMCDAEDLYGASVKRCKGSSETYSCDDGEWSSCPSGVPLIPLTVGLGLSGMALAMTTCRLYSARRSGDNELSSASWSQGVPAAGAAPVEPA